jgi:DNA-binding transcriptional regulator YiaG
MERPVLDSHALTEPAELHRQARPPHGVLDSLPLLREQVFGVHHRYLTDEGLEAFADLMFDASVGFLGPDDQLPGLAKAAPFQLRDVGDAQPGLLGHCHGHQPEHRDPLLYPFVFNMSRWLLGHPRMMLNLPQRVAYLSVTALERGTAQLKGLRCSFPPYYVAAMTPDGWPVAALPGDSYEILERGLAPSAEESRQTLLHLRQQLRWSRAGMAAFLGVPRGTLRRWETGERRPSGAARRLIWLLNLLVDEPDKLKSAFDLVVWGRSEEMRDLAKQLEGQSNLATTG